MSTKMDVYAIDIRKILRISIFTKYINFYPRNKAHRRIKIYAYKSIHNKQLNKVLRLFISVSVTKPKKSSTI